MNKRIKTARALDAAINARLAQPLGEMGLVLDTVPSTSWRIPVGPDLAAGLAVHCATVRTLYGYKPAGAEPLYAAQLYVGAGRPSEGFMFSNDLVASGSTPYGFLSPEGYAQLSTRARMILEEFGYHEGYFSAERYFQNALDLALSDPFSMRYPFPTTDSVDEWWELMRPAVLAGVEAAIEFYTSVRDLVRPAEPLPDMPPPPFHVYGDAYDAAWDDDELGLPPSDPEP